MRTNATQRDEERADLLSSHRCSMSVAADDGRPMRVDVEGVELLIV